MAAPQSLGRLVAAILAQQFGILHGCRSSFVPVFGVVGLGLIKDNLPFVFLTKSASTRVCASFCPQSVTPLRVLRAMSGFASKNLVSVTRKPPSVELIGCVAPFLLLGSRSKGDLPLKSCWLLQGRCSRSFIVTTNTTTDESEPCQPKRNSQNLKVSIPRSIPPGA